MTLHAHLRTFRLLAMVVLKKTPVFSVKQRAEAEETAEHRA